MNGQEWPSSSGPFYCLMWHSWPFVQTLLILWQSLGNSIVAIEHHTHVYMYQVRFAWFRTCKIFFYVIRILKSWKFWKTFIFGIHFEQEITSGLVMLFCVMGMCTCVLVLIILYVWVCWLSSQINQFAFVNLHCKRKHEC